MTLVAASIYWLIVPLWLTVLGTLVTFYVRNPRVFGTTRLLLAVVAIDTCRNIVENVYFGLYFGAQYGLFSTNLVGVLGNPFLLIIPKIINVAAGGFVLGLLLLRWLPSAVREHARSQQNAVDLEALTAIDAMTGLYNRQQFELLADAEWARFQRYLRPLSVLVVDLDQFKAINDRYGHDVSDRAIACVAAACSACRSASDTIARTDLHEFAFLLPDSGEAEARLIAENLRDAVRENCAKAGDEVLNLTVSIGIATATLSMSSIATLMKRADGALYEATRAGRDRVAKSSGGLGENLDAAAA